MVVKRVSDLDIRRRGFITAISGNFDDSFVDDDLCTYTFDMQLYLYLLNEGYNRVCFYSRAMGYGWYSFDKDSLSHATCNDSEGENEEENDDDGYLNTIMRNKGVDKNTRKDINKESRARKDGPKEKRTLGRPYYCITEYKDSTLIEKVQDILRDTSKKSVVYFTSPEFSIQEVEGFVSGIEQIMNAAQSENKLLIKYNSNGVFRLPFFADLFKDQDNVFVIGAPDKNECGNWLHSKRINGFIGNDDVWDSQFDYSQYKSIKKMDREFRTNKAAFMNTIVFKQKTDDEVFAELNAMIGLNEVKKTLHGIADNEKAKRLRAKFGHTSEGKVNLNFVFKGNPGTGKTTVAGLLGNILANYRLIDCPAVVKYTKGQLLDGFVGGGSRLVEKMFMDSVGKVLFIDEAYQLADDDAKDVRDAITNMLTDPRFENKIAVVLAGYPGDMAELISGNPGLKSRFTQNIFFEDYTNDELTEIFRRMLVSEDFIINEDSLVYAKAYFSSLRRNKDFGNARVAKNLRDEVKMKLGTRTRNLSNPTKEDVFTILPQDFPNYGKIDLDKYKSMQDASISPMDQLNQLIGIDDIREHFETYIGMARFCRENPQSKISATFRPHMAFLGNPGTGKTTVARLFAEILRKEGLLTNSNFVEVGPSDLIGEYLGKSGPKARGQFERARGGVLFIDEAYQLCRQGQLNGGDQYGKEVITELIKFMEDDRDTVVILAGYTNEIRYLIQKGNPGLASRVTNEFLFKDYEPDVLFDILLNKLGEFEMSEGFKIEMMKVINERYRNRNNEWGNAREIENYAKAIFQKYLLMNQAKGIIDEDCIPEELKLRKEESL